MMERRDRRIRGGETDKEEKKKRRREEEKESVKEETKESSKKMVGEGKLVDFSLINKMKSLARVSELDIVFKSSIPGEN